MFDLIGDYNGDGITTADDGSVDSGDYVTWRWAYDHGIYDSRADGDDDGYIDMSDYTVWSSHFGNTLDLEDVDV